MNIKQTSKYTILGSSALGVVYAAHTLGTEKFIVDQVIEAAKQGDFPKILGYAVIFFFIWIEVRGLKKEVAKLNDPEGPISKAFAKGEQRFDNLEQNHINFEHRLTMLEQSQGVKA